MSNLSTSPRERVSPKVAYEPVEWLEYRAFETGHNDLPRILLIGDSISGQYFDGVATELRGKAYISRLGSSASVCLPSYLKEIEFALLQPYSVIHFNNGLHGWAYTEPEYAQGLSELVAFLKIDAFPAHLIWASSTPLREGPDFKKMAPDNERVKARNALATDLMVRENIPINDLYTMLESEPGLTSDGTHYHPEGAKLMVRQVTRSLETFLC